MIDFQHILVSNCITERCTVSLQTKETGYVFPLYLYPPSIDPTLDSAKERIPNLQIEIVQHLSLTIGIQFSPEKEESLSTFSPIDLLDYIYAILYSPSYRAKYKEFLKIDFPRVPYPINVDTFWNLVKLGGELRQIHLLESPVLNKLITTYPVNVLSYEDIQHYQKIIVALNETDRLMKEIDRIEVVN